MDLQSVNLWDEFTEKKFKMLKKTHTSASPWMILRSDNKHFARREAMKYILNAVRYRGRNRTLDFTLHPNIAVAGDKELKMMKKQRKEYGKFIS